MTARIDTPEYRQWYRKGWRYSQRDSATLDYGDSQNFPEAWYDGYLDFGTGREMWHYLHCVDPDTCPQH